MIRTLMTYAVPRILLAGFSLLLAACVSSEETGTGKKIDAPVTSQTVPESMREKVDSMTRTDSFRSRRGGFTSEHDTLMASVVRTSKPGRRAIKPIERPANPAYTVQIGAFARTDHALRAQKLAKDRFADLPIFNTFETYDRLYRVRVGKYDGRQQADSLRKQMIRQFPNEYSNSWVNYISK